jgi:NarL family two-component system response regulator LiaR
MTQPIRVLVVDDHLVVRRGLATLLLAFDDLALVGEAKHGAEALGMCASARLDVVLMDMVMPGMDGAETTAEIRRRYPEIQVIALTSFAEDDLVQRAMRAGAIGYLLKNTSAHELAAAIRSAHAGRPTLAAEALDAVIRTASAPDASAPQHVEELTAREREILPLMARGQTNTQIGAQLGISQATVKFHISSILGKLGAASRTEAVALAIQRGLVN